MDYDKYFVLDIVKNKYSGNLYNYNYLNLVLEMGNKEQKRELLEKFREDYNIEDRQKEKFSLETKPEWSYDEKYKYDGVLSLIMANLSKLSIDEEYNDMDYGLFDFNPQIRHASLLALLAVKDYKMIPEIGLQIKRLLAETPHVRDAAMEVMTKYNLSLKQNEYDEIISKLGDKIDDEGKNKLSNYIN